jgi:hypothetical protein
MFDVGGAVGISMLPSSDDSALVENKARWVEA